MTTDVQNGHARGGAVPALPTHTFKDSGVTVRLHKLSPMTSQDIAAQCRRDLAESEPQPPIVEVDYGQGKVKQPHTGDPTYVRLHEEWESQVNKLANERLFKLAALLAVEVTIGEAEQRRIADAKRLLRITARVTWQDDPDLTPEENEQLFYVRHIACGSPDDLVEFYKAVATRSQPTEAAIEWHKETFPGDVSGPVDLDV